MKFAQYTSSCYIYIILILIIYDHNHIWYVTVCIWSVYVLFGGFLSHRAIPLVILIFDWHFPVHKNHPAFLGVPPVRWKPPSWDWHPWRAAGNLPLPFAAPGLHGSTAAHAIAKPKRLARTLGMIQSPEHEFHLRFSGERWFFWKTVPENQSVEELVWNP